MQSGPRRVLGAWLRGVTALLLGLATSVGAQAQRPPVVAAASDLQYALEEVARTYRQATQREVRLVFGSSGLFATQIRNGAPFELYLSADEDYVLGLHAAGLTRDAGVVYAQGRLALVAPEASPLAVDAELKGLAALVRAGGLRRFAIANPEHAPYGRRAAEVLARAGLWEALQPRLVLGENVSQAAQFAIAGGADGGIVALALVRSPMLEKRVRHAVLPATWHRPLQQRMVLLPGAGPGAEAFYAHLQQAGARAILRRYGFLLPGEPE